MSSLILGFELAFYLGICGVEKWEGLGIYIRKAKMPGVTVS